MYADAARLTGKLIAAGGHTLIYGGGNIGLMGILADATLSRGGSVKGVIPEFLVKREVAHRGVTDLVIVGSMHERKQRMADLADVFIALPGGWGTLDELAEILTWRQLGIIDQPIGLLNVQSFFTPLLEQMNILVSKGFLSSQNIGFLTVENSPSKLLTALGVVTV